MLCMVAKKENKTKKQFWGATWGKDCFRTKKELSEKDSQVKQDFLNFLQFLKIVTYLE